MSSSSGWLGLPSLCRRLLLFDLLLKHLLYRELFLWCVFECQWGFIILEFIAQRRSSGRKLVIKNEFLSFEKGFKTLNRSSASIMRDVLDADFCQKITGTQ